MTTTTHIGNPDPALRPVRRPPRWAVAMVAAAVAVLVGGGVALWRTGSGSSADPTPSPSAGVPATTATTAPVGPPTAGPSLPGTLPGTPSASATIPSVAFRFTPLWPFGSVADAVAWQRDAGAGGHQPWRLDAEDSAVAFARDYLGYTEIDRVMSTQTVGDQAWVGVGFTPPVGAEGAQSTVAVLHLARIGGGPLSTRPWEVVGTRDTDLTLTTPRYGATVGSTFTVGGRITGVDESLVVQVTSLRGDLYSASRGLPAGGERTAWSTTITLARPRSGIATVAVATGGHLMDVERFAITAVSVKLPTGFVTPEGALKSLVTRGTYLGDCSTIGSTTGIDDPVCSAFVQRDGVRYLYRVGYWQTDVGYFVALGKDGAGRWVVLDPYLEAIP